MFALKISSSSVENQNKFKPSFSAIWMEFPSDANKMTPVNIDFDVIFAAHLGVVLFFINIITSEN